MEWQTLLIIVNITLWRVQILSLRSVPVHLSLGWGNCPTSEDWCQTLKVQPGLHCRGVGPFLHPYEESKPKVILAYTGVSTDPIIIPQSWGESFTSVWIVNSPQPWYHDCSCPTYSFMDHTGVTNLSQVMGGHMIPFLLNAFWCGHWLCVFSHILEGLCQDGQYLIWHKICQVKLVQQNCLIAFEPAEWIYTGWVPNVPWLWYFWVYFLLP